jgi:hypothetical protein
MAKVISPVKLSFDPDTVDDETTRNVFKDEIARNLWLAISPSFLRGPYFAGGCLRAAEQLNEQQLLTNAAQSAEQIKQTLRSCFGSLGREITSDEFFPQLLPVLSGERKLEFQIIQ